MSDSTSSRLRAAGRRMMGAFAVLALILAPAVARAGTLAVGETDGDIFFYDTAATPTAGNDSIASLSLSSIIQPATVGGTITLHNIAYDSATGDLWVAMSGAAQNLQVLRNVGGTWASVQGFDITKPVYDVEVVRGIQNANPQIYYSYNDKSSYDVTLASYNGTTAAPLIQTNRYFPDGVTNQFGFEGLALDDSGNVWGFPGGSWRNELLWRYDTVNSDESQYAEYAGQADGAADGVYHDGKLFLGDSNANGDVHIWYWTLDANGDATAQGLYTFDSQLPGKGYGIEDMVFDEDGNLWIIGRRYRTIAEYDWANGTWTVVDEDVGGRSGDLVTAAYLASVPEPASLVLLALGGALMLPRRRRDTAEPASAGGEVKGRRYGVRFES